MSIMRKVFSISTLCFVIAAQAGQGPYFPDHRIVAYYGNYDSPHMGVIGEYPPDEVISMLKHEMNKWTDIDPQKPVVPAIEYIVTVAQQKGGSDDKYRLHMPESEIEKAMTMAAKVDGLVILDVQIGLSDVQAEIPRLEKYLSLPNVMLALDPEFSMVTGDPPGTVIGSMNAKAINYAIDYLADLVKAKNLPPKFLVVHRFTQHMVTDYKDIKPVPEVQVVMDMDGWGPKSLKRDSYKDYIEREPVQFTGIKLFYHNDMKEPSTGLLTPEEIMKLKPVPLFILYQ